MPVSNPVVLQILAEPVSIARLAPDDPIPSWVEGAAWFCVTRTPQELSVVCDSRLVPQGVRQAGPWRAMRVAGTLEFDLTGILSRIAGPLAAARISIFALSTYDTDYVLVRERDLERAVHSLRDEGLTVETAR